MKVGSDASSAFDVGCWIGLKRILPSVLSRRWRVEAIRAV
jgi:hypothetical protein